MLGASSPSEQQASRGQAPEEELSLEAQFTRAQARVCFFLSLAAALLPERLSLSSTYVRRCMLSLSQQRERNLK